MREADIAVDDASFEAMGIDELVDLGREAGIIDLRELSCHGTGALIQLTLEERFDESRLDALDYVDKWEHLAERDDHHVYLVSFTAPALPDDLGDRAAALVGTCDPTIDEYGTALSLVGSQPDIAATIEAYESAGVSPDLNRLREYDGGDHPLSALTDRQREIVSTAHELGYYEVPRRVSIDDIAAEFDVDSSTVAEHLQRAERNLLDTLL